MTIALLICMILPCFLTTFGAFFVFFFRQTSEKWARLANSLAAGIMLSASIFSLLIPAVDASQDLSTPAYILIVGGFCLGIFLMIFFDFLIERFCKKKYQKNTKIVKKYTKKPQKMAKKLNFWQFSLNFCNFQAISNQRNFCGQKKAIKFFTAITIHNIPEGLCVGLALGSAAALGNSVSSAVMLAVGIGLQNLPEGLATALPLKKAFKSGKKAFFLAFLSGVVEPIFAILGYILSTQLTTLLPTLLALSAGSMIFVIVEELLSEISISPFMFGFVLMMLLDLAL